MCPRKVRRFYLNDIYSRNKKAKKKDTKDIDNTQTSLSKFYESTELTKERCCDINKSLLHSFVMTGTVLLLSLMMTMIRMVEFGEGIELD